VADEVHAAWVAFVRDGDPGWPVHGVAGTVRRFGAPSETVTDPWAAAREAWAGRDF
jgi:para-nitrobenzyl esterase